MAWRLVDGGILNNVPADVLVNQGATFIVAVDVSAKIGHSFVGNTPETPTEEMNIPNMFQTLGRVRAAQDRNIRKMGAGDADLTIEPDVSAFQLTDFQNASAIAPRCYCDSQNVTSAKNSFETVGF